MKNRYLAMGLILIVFSSCRHSSSDSRKQEKGSAEISHEFQLSGSFEYKDPKTGRTWKRFEADMASYDHASSICKGGDWVLPTKDDFETIRKSTLSKRNCHWPNGMDAPAGSLNRCSDFWIRNKTVVPGKAKMKLNGFDFTTGKASTYGLYEGSEFLLGVMCMKKHRRDGVEEYGEAEFYDPKNDNFWKKSRDPEQGLTFYDASQACKGDWKIPTYNELKQLHQDEPVHSNWACEWSKQLNNPSIFHTHCDKFWTVNVFEPDQQYDYRRHLLYQFYNGKIKQVPTSDNLATAKLLCIKRKNDLVWAQQPVGYGPGKEILVTQEEAKTVCPSPWRLPTISELDSFQSESYDPNNCSEELFAGQSVCCYWKEGAKGKCSASYFWSSTSLGPDSLFAKAFPFIINEDEEKITTYDNRGIIVHKNGSGKAMVRCVR